MGICFYKEYKLDNMIAMLAPITDNMMHTIMNIKTNFFMMCSVYHYINKTIVLLPFTLGITHAYYFKLMKS